MSYRDLKTYQSAVIIYDFTTEFCNLYIDKRSRTHDQMVQAARSGKQNIVEGSSERTSKKSELKLLGVSRASFQELLEDYEDFLRQRGFVLWGKDSDEAREVRGLAYRTDKTYQTYGSYLSDPGKAANCMICLINQENFLLDRQIKSLEERFVKDGGYTEELFRKRLNYRQQ
jgi:four helix bundle suffix protein